MYGQKQHPGGLSAKIELLQSNTNRVVNQHESLCELMQNSYTVGRLKYNIELVNEAMERVQKLKQNSEKILNDSEWYKNKVKSSLEQSKLEYQTKELQNQLNFLKQLVSKRKKQLKVQSKYNSSKGEEYFSQIKRKNDQQIQTLKKNVMKYLDNVKQEVIKNNERRVIEFVNNSLLEESKPYCEDIQSQIGLLICQLQYQNYKRTKNQYSKQVLEVEKKFKAQKQTYMKELEYGKLERKLAIKNLSLFYVESKKRLIYDCHLLLKKTQAAIQCIKANIKVKQRPTNIIIKYDERSKELKKKIECIGHQISGMKIQMKFLIQKIRILDAKIMALGCEQKQQISEFKVEDEEIEMNYLLCQQKIKDFNKLRAQFIFQPN